MMKRIVLCADDYGQAPAISQGILSLVQAKRLSAVSCMVNTPHWQEYAAKLKPYQQQIDIGLHFNLTHGAPLSAAYQQQGIKRFPGLNHMLHQSFTRRLNEAMLIAECCAQIEAFQANMGFLPAFIDGHQHIHQFPIIRAALIAAYEQYWSNQTQTRPFIRLVSQFTPASLKSLLKLAIIQMGSLFFKRTLREKQIPHNLSFNGIYPFSASAQYHLWFPRFLSKITDQGLIMCHPGMLAVDQTDPIAKARYDEYCYLISSQFLIDCEHQGTVLIRFNA